MGYLDGVSEEIAVQRAVEQRRVVIGEDRVYTDKATVKSVQKVLGALAKATGKSEFDAGKVDGIIGPNTRAAVTAFNRAYGWPDDGDKITDGTLTALKRPDVLSPPKTEAPPPPPPPTPAQVERMVSPIVNAASAALDAVPPQRSTSVFQREVPRSPAAAAAVDNSTGGAQWGKWVLVGVSCLAGVGVLWLVGDALFGRGGGDRSRSRAAFAKTVPGMRRV